MAGAAVCDRAGSTKAPPATTKASKHATGNLRVFSMTSSRPLDEPLVMAGLVPAIHAFPCLKTWMPGTRPGMTMEKRLIAAHQHVGLPQRAELTFSLSEAS